MQTRPRVPKIVKRVLLVLLILVLLVALTVGGYLAWMLATYQRIEDGAPLPVENPQAARLVRGEGYTALTHNIGFGAYNRDFSFFLDTGVMADGTAVQGQHARAESAEVVRANTEGVADAALRAAPDFCLFQEVDIDADRSHHVNQTAMLREALGGYAAVYASNFHTAFLAWPPQEMIGAVQSGLLTLSRCEIAAATRVSLPVTQHWLEKFFDLDRCLAVLRLPVEGGGELVLINCHLSAYDAGGTIRAAQLDVVGQLLRQERDKGNWVIVGGDYNHVLCGAMDAFPSGQQVPAWVYPFDRADLPDGFRVVCADNAAAVPTCRSTDLPYEPGVNYTAVLDGFMVSDNVQATAHNLDEGFAHSDHNPVLLRFELQ